ncbi:MAG: 23S rRNA (adenine(2503)-C(2))-methyltransferase RlmN [Firmicutes bacterium]|jgi:23S rRNA (adenine2503-C2)-methyltransferase|nr:23S rRNA (adenine(2503)-C(2))-methyltransferase RlmN [Bacillota bacterium]
MLGISDGKQDILDLTLREAEEFFEGLGEPRYRARQVFRWAYARRQADFAAMSDLPAWLRERLTETAFVGTLRAVAQKSSRDGRTTKFLFGLADGEAVESVLMRHDYGYTACVSSQVGCRMACGFCASTRGGLVRNLRTGEMVGQVTGINALLPAEHRVSRAVLMGSGEPLDNYESCVKFIRVVNEPLGLNIGMRHITLSTCGIVPGILRLAREGLQITLSVSLHSPTDAVRRSLMPVAGKYPVREVVRACREYGDATGRRVTFEYALIEGVNDSDSDAREVARLLNGGLFHVNIIPLNPVRGTPYRRSPPRRVKEFYVLLENMGIAVTVRREFGIGVDAACGQLRRRSARGGADGM